MGSIQRMIVNTIGVIYILHFFQWIFYTVDSFQSGTLGHGELSPSPEGMIFFLIIFGGGSLLAGILLLTVPKVGIPIAFLRSLIGIYFAILLNHFLNLGLIFTSIEGFLVFWPSAFFLISNLILLYTVLSWLRRKGKQSTSSYGAYIEREGPKLSTIFITTFILTGITFMASLFFDLFFTGQDKPLSDISQDSSTCVNKKTYYRLEEAIKEPEKICIFFSSFDNRTFPVEILSFTNLEELTLGGGISQIPPEISILKKLRRLDLQGNGLTQLPPEIWELTQLRRLALWNNQLTYLPPEIGNLSNLEKLYLGGNKLKEIPPEIGNLTHLRSLDLSENEFTGVPVEIGKLNDSLKNLLLRNNKLNLVEKIKVRVLLFRVNILGLWSSL